MGEDVDLMSEVSVLLTESELEVKTIEIDADQLIVKTNDDKCYSIVFKEINGKQADP